MAGAEHDHLSLFFNGGSQTPEFLGLSDQDQQDTVARVFSGANAIAVTAICELTGIVDGDAIDQRTMELFGQAHGEAIDEMRRAYAETSTLGDEATIIENVISKLQTPGSQ